MAAATATVSRGDDDAFLLSVTAAITIVTTAIIDLTINATGLPSDVAGLKGAPGVASPVVYHWLAKRRNGTGLVPSGLVPFRGFTLRWPVVAVLGGLTILGAAEFGSFVGGLLTAAIEGALGASIVTAVFASYLVGRWIGMRADARPFVAALVAVAIARVVGTVVDWIFLPADMRQQLGLTVEALPVLIIVGLVTWGIPAIIGAWRGRVAREGAYLTYLMSRVTPKSRTTVLEMVYEDAVKAAAAPPAQASQAATVG